MVLKLKDKVAIITGAASGMGRATAIIFAREGAKVVVADIDVKGGEETVRIIKEDRGEATFVKTDVSSLEDVQNMVRGTAEEFGRIDILFNNAGTAGSKPTLPIQDQSVDEWDKVINVNLKGVFLCCKYTIPYMIKAGGGAIINTSSIAGYVGFANFAHYAASKGGVIALTKSLALECAPYKIRVNAIAPGTFDTSINIPVAKSLGMTIEEYNRQFANKHPLMRAYGRVGRPEEVAHLVLYLASDEAALITGVIIPIDGGITAGPSFYT